VGGRVGSSEKAAGLVAEEGAVVVLELGVAPSDEDHCCMTAWYIGVCRAVNEKKGVDKNCCVR